MMAGSGGKLWFAIRDALNAEYGTDVQVQAKTWMHLACVYDREASITCICVNGPSTDTITASLLVV